MRRTTRYQAAIIRDHHLLLLRAIDHKSQQSYWLIPGGGREADETEEACVQREVLEETGVEVEVERLLLDEAGVGDGIYQRLKTYTCRILDGEPQPGSEPEVDTDELTTIQEVGWFDLRAPESWCGLVRADPITYPLLERIRVALGYNTEHDGHLGRSHERTHHHE